LLLVPVAREGGEGKFLLSTWLTMIFNSYSQRSEAAKKILNTKPQSGRKAHEDKK